MTSPDAGEEDGGAPRSILLLPILAAARVAVLAMIAVTVADVVGRRFLGISVSGVVEIVEFALIWSAFLGIAIGFAVGGHIRLDLADHLLGAPVLRVLDALSTAALVALLAWLTSLAVEEFMAKLEWEDRTVDLGIPLTWYWAAIVCGYALSTAILAVMLVRPGIRAGPGAGS